MFECCIRDGLCELSNNRRGCLIGGGGFCYIPEPGQCLRLSRAEAPDHREIVHLLGGSERLISKRNSIRRSVQAQQNAHLHFEGGDGGRSEPALVCLRGGCLGLAESFVQCALGEEVGFDHGVGHSLLVLCDAKAPHGKKWNDFKALENYLFIVSISLS